MENRKNFDLQAEAKRIHFQISQVNGFYLTEVELSILWKIPNEFGLYSKEDLENLKKIRDGLRERIPNPWIIFY